MNETKKGRNVISVNLKILEQVNEVVYLRSMFRDM